jgi:hypothetical protein
MTLGHIQVTEVSPQIAPTAAYSRTAFGAPRSAAQLIIPQREVGDQFMAGKWNPSTPTAWPFANGGGNNDEEWVYVDLGAEYNLEEIRIWNGDYQETAGQNPWRAKLISVHVGGTGAVLPVGYYVDGVSVGEVPTATDGDGNLNMFLGAGWTKIHDADLAQGPGCETLTEGQLLNPELTLDATGNNGIRYVAIDFDSDYGGGSLMTLGHIRVTEGAAPATPGTLIYGK